MTFNFGRCVRQAGVALAAMSFAPFAMAQAEFAPPQGKGHVVIVASGQSGTQHYQTVAKDIAKLGYDVLLYDGNAFEGSKGETLKQAVAAGPSAAHALPGKVAVVGFSLGGGMALAYASRWPDQVAVDIDWYPLTKELKDLSVFAAGIKVPVLMFAGEADAYKDCCLIGTARKLAEAAKGAGAPFELVTYPGVKHDFVDGGSGYNAGAYKDALKRTAEKLKAAFGD